MKLLRSIGFVLLAVALSSSSAPAQNNRTNPNDPIAASMPPPPVEESSGDPLYGYLATAFLAAGAIFAICKSSRR